MRQRIGWRQGGRGASRLGVLVVLLLLGAGLYAATFYVPAYWTYLSMFDPVKEAAMTAASSAGETKARQEVVARAKSLGLELGDDAVEVARVDAEVLVRVNWSVPIALPHYPHTLHFQIEKRSPVL